MQEAQRRKEAVLTLPRRASSRQAVLKERADEVTREVLVISDEF